jgi:hypothetical protein
MACEAQKAALDAINQKVAAIENTITHTPAPERAAAQAAAAHQLATLAAEGRTASAAYQKCLSALQPQRVAGLQPQEILQTPFQTPKFGGNGDPKDDWATRIAGGEFPEHQGFEWKQVMDTNNEYDETPAGATGWACYQDTSAHDSIGLHPFGGDWEFALALDSQYLNLCSFGNTALNSGDTSKPDAPQILKDLPPLGIPSADIQNAASFGLLGVEMENGLVPQEYQAAFHDGDRVAVFGRWIVDTGHTDYHTEIHPPLLLANACVYSDPSTGQQFTRTLVTSRPYLTSQLFTTGTGTNDIYNDTSGDDGHFLEHLLKEIAKAETPIPFLGSLQVEAHPKIKQFPFKGVHIFELIVKAPALKTTIAGSATAHPLQVSFKFTYRTGCGVQVIPNDASSVKVIIAMNSTGYTPPPLPARHDLKYSLTELKDALGPSTGDEVAGVAAAIANILLDPSGAAVLSRGLLTDQYAALPTVDFYRTDTAGAALHVSGTAIPAGVGITLNNNQPFPLTGWIEVGYGAPKAVLATDLRAGVVQAAHLEAAH